MEIKGTFILSDNTDIDLFKRAFRVQIQGPSKELGETKDDIDPAIEYVLTHLMTVEYEEGS